MVRRHRYWILFVLLPLFVAAACGGQIPEGWRVIGAEDVEHTRLLRAVSCGDGPEVGLMVDAEALPPEDKNLIDGLPVERKEGDLRIIRPDATSLASIFLMTGADVAIDDETARSLPPLLSPEFTGTTESVTVILDLPMEGFSEHLAQLTEELSADAGASLRAMATTGQVSATLSQESLRRLEALASVCAVYPDAMRALAE